MGIFNNDFEPWPDMRDCKYPDRPMHWTDEDEYHYQQELKQKEEELETGLHFRS